MADLANLDDLKARLDWTLDADEERIATAALEDASDLARHYGSASWLDEASSPRLARTLVLKACKRYMQNPEGVIQSRAGDETMAWDDAAGENAGTVYFTKDERDLLAGLSGKRPGIYSVPLTAHRSQDVDEVGYVPVTGDVPFPMFADPVSPW
jgi:hypothetical protein